LDIGTHLNHQLDGMNDCIKIDSVFLEFQGKKVLRGASLSIEKNQVIGILGRNGCGKSCFLKVITGQLQADFRYISHNNVQMKNLYKKKGLINYLPQHNFHPKSLKISTLISYYGIKKENFASAYPFLKEKLNRRFSELSGGERRIVEVLLVLESPSQYSILDEPFTHVMPIQTDIIKASIQRIKQRKGILVTDHQYTNVLDVSDKIFLLKDGTMQAINDESDLRKKGYIL